MPENPAWGGFAEIWGGPDEIHAVQSKQFCASQAYVDAHFAMNPDGLTTNYDDLKYTLESVEGVKETFNVETVDEWLEVWGSDADTQEDFVLSMNCLESSIKEADAAAALLPTVLAIYLLIF